MDSQLSDKRKNRSDRLSNHQHQQQSLMVSVLPNWLSMIHATYIRQTHPTPLQESEFLSLFIQNEMEHSDFATIFEGLGMKQPAASIDQLQYQQERLNLQMTTITETQQAPAPFEEEDCVFQLIEDQMMLDPEFAGIFHENDNDDSITPALSIDVDIDIEIDELEPINDTDEILSYLQGEMMLDPELSPLFTKEAAREGEGIPLEDEWEMEM